MGYTLIALLTDLAFELYQAEMERIEGRKLSSAKDVIEVKSQMFQDLMPISDDYVVYKDFAIVKKKSEWNRLLQSMQTMV